MSPDHQPTADAIFQLNDKEQDELRIRILRLKSQLAATFVAKDHIAHLIVVSAIAGEPLLLVGAPGTGKSAIVKRFVGLLGVPSGHFFEYVITPNTHPSELAQREPDETGQGGQPNGQSLMTAQVAFLDEVFHANSAVLNPLLRRLGRAEWPSNTTRSQGGVSLVVAATRNLDHPVPNESLLDRFTLQATCETVHRERFSDVIRIGIRRDVDGPSSVLDPESAADPNAMANPSAGGISSSNADTRAEADVDGGEESGNATEDGARAGGQIDSRCSVADFARASNCVRARLVESARGEDDALGFANVLGYADFERLIRRLGREDRVFVSDRKLIKLFKLLTTEAWLRGEPQLARSTLHLLSYIGNTADEMQILADKVPLLIDQL